MLDGMPLKVAPQLSVEGKTSRLVQCTAFNNGPAFRCSIVFLLPGETGMRPRKSVVVWLELK